jgi:hypothetical protein
MLTSGGSGELTEAGFSAARASSSNVSASSSRKSKASSAAARKAESQQGVERWQAEASPGLQHDDQPASCTSGQSAEPGQRLGGHRHSHRAGSSATPHTSPYKSTRHASSPVQKQADSASSSGAGSMGRQQHSAAATITARREVQTETGCSNGHMPQSKCSLIHQHMEQESDCPTQAATAAAQKPSGTSGSVPSCGGWTQGHSITGMPYGGNAPPSQLARADRSFVALAGGYQCSASSQVLSLDALCVQASNGEEQHAGFIQSAPQDRRKPLLDKAGAVELEWGASGSLGVQVEALRMAGARAAKQQPSDKQQKAPKLVAHGSVPGAVAQHGMQQRCHAAEPSIATQGGSSEVASPGKPRSAHEWQTSERASSRQGTVACPQPAIPAPLSVTSHERRNSAATRNAAGTMAAASDDVDEWPPVPNQTSCEWPAAPLAACDPSHRASIAAPAHSGAAKLAPRPPSALAGLPSARSRRSSRATQAAAAPAAITPAGAHSDGGLAPLQFDEHGVRTYKCSRCLCSMQTWLVYLAVVDLQFCKPATARLAGEAIWRGRTSVRAGVAVLAEQPANMCNIVTDHGEAEADSDLVGISLLQFMSSLPLDEDAADNAPGSRPCSRHDFPPVPSAPYSMPACPTNATANATNERSKQASRAGSKAGAWSGRSTRSHQQPEPTHLRSQFSKLSDVEMRPGTALVESLSPQSAFAPASRQGSAFQVTEVSLADMAPHLFTASEEAAASSARHESARLRSVRSQADLAASWTADEAGADTVAAAEGYTAAASAAAEFALDLTAPASKARGASGRVGARQGARPGSAARKGSARRSGQGERQPSARGASHAPAPAAGAASNATSQAAAARGEDGQKARASEDTQRWATRHEQPRHRAQAAPVDTSSHANNTNSSSSVAADHARPSTPVMRLIQSARPVSPNEPVLDPAVWSHQALARPPSRQKPPPEALHLFAGMGDGEGGPVWGGEQARARRFCERRHQAVAWRVCAPCRFSCAHMLLAAH